MNELVSWLPAIITMVGVGAGWGKLVQETKARKEEQHNLRSDLREIKEMLRSTNGMPSYVTRNEWEKFLIECHTRHQ